MGTGGRGVAIPTLPSGCGGCPDCCSLSLSDRFLKKLTILIVQAFMALPDKGLDKGLGIRFDRDGIISFITPQDVFEHPITPFTRDLASFLVKLFPLNGQSTIFSLSPASTLLLNARAAERFFSPPARALKPPANTGNRYFQDAINCRAYLKTIITPSVWRLDPGCASAFRRSEQPSRRRLPEFRHPHGS